MTQMLEFANEYLITIINTLDDLVKRGHKTDGEISREMKIKKKKKPNRNSRIEILNSKMKNSFDMLNSILDTA